MHNGPTYFVNFWKSLFGRTRKRNVLGVASFSGVYFLRQDSD